MMREIVGGISRCDPGTTLQSTDCIRPHKYEFATGLSRTIVLDLLQIYQKLLLTVVVRVDELPARRSLRPSLY